MKRSFLIPVLCITLYAANSMTAQTVDMPDANLKAAILGVLNEDSTNISQTDMLRLTTLDAGGKGITDITGLEYALNLEDLRLSDNQIENLNPLTGLTNLKKLFLQGNQISDINALADLMDLIQLEVQDNYQIADISAVENMVKLIRLRLDGNMVTDISALSQLTEIEHLQIDRNQIEDISSLAGMENLVYLEMYGNLITDISVIAYMSNLKVLRINENDITDISSLDGLIRLQHLNIDRNQIADISVLADKVELTILDASYNQIDDISALANLLNLANLYLNLNYISDISPLTDLRNLQELNLTGNPLQLGSEDVIAQIEENNPGIDLQYNPIPKHPVYSGGSGTSEDPYQIATKETLIAIGKAYYEYDKHFILVSDIDLIDETFIGAVIAPDWDYSDWYFQGIPFKGTFNGNSHIVENITIDCGDDGGDALGLFGNIDPNGVVIDLGIRDCFINTGYWPVYIGGLVGQNAGSVSGCYATGEINAGIWPYYIGGLIGLNKGSVENSYSHVNIVTDKGCSWTGGFIGMNSGYVAYCYAASVLECTEPGAGLGGFVGLRWNDIAVEGCFWDIDTSNLSESAAGTGLSTSQMQDINTYIDAGWDFVDETINGVEDIWQMPSAGGSPLLTWQNEKP